MFILSVSWLLGFSDIFKIKQVTNLAWQPGRCYVWEENVFLLCFLFLFTQVRAPSQMRIRGNVAKKNIVLSTCVPLFTDDSGRLNIIAFIILIQRAVALGLNTEYRLWCRCFIKLQRRLSHKCQLHCWSRTWKPPLTSTCISKRPWQSWSDITPKDSELKIHVTP